MACRGSSSSSQSRVPAATARSGSSGMLGMPWKFAISLWSISRMKKCSDSRTRPSFSRAFMEAGLRMGRSSQEWDQGRIRNREPTATVPVFSLLQRSSARAFAARPAGAAALLRPWGDLDRVRRVAGAGRRALRALVAQLDRAPDYESGGRGFESSRARQSLQGLTGLFADFRGPICHFSHPQFSLLDAIRRFCSRFEPHHRYRRPSRQRLCPRSAWAYPAARLPLCT